MGLGCACGPRLQPGTTDRLRRLQGGLALMALALIALALVGDSTFALHRCETLCVSQWGLFLAGPISLWCAASACRPQLTSNFSLARALVSGAACMLLGVDPIRCGARPLAGLMVVLQAQAFVCACGGLSRPVLGKKPHMSQVKSGRLFCRQLSCSLPRGWRYRSFTSSTVEEQPPFFMQHGGAGRMLWQFPPPSREGGTPTLYSVLSSCEEEDEEMQFAYDSDCAAEPLTSDGRRCRTPGGAWGGTPRSLYTPGSRKGKSPMSHHTRSPPASSPRGADSQRPGSRILDAAMTPPQGPPQVGRSPAWDLTPPRTRSVGTGTARPLLYALQSADSGSPHEVADILEPIEPLARTDSHCSLSNSSTSHAGSISASISASPLGTPSRRSRTPFRKGGGGGESSRMTIWDLNDALSRCPSEADDDPTTASPQPAAATTTVAAATTAAAALESV